jgi:hypothetical protein
MQLTPEAKDGLMAVSHHMATAPSVSFNLAAVNWATVGSIFLTALAAGAAAMNWSALITALLPIFGVSPAPSPTPTGTGPTITGKP